LRLCLIPASVHFFAPGNEQGKGWHEAAAKAEVFKDTQHFDELAAAFAKEKNELESVVSTGDQAAMKLQFG
jgi:cytochrome c556